jgi:hypothetical protein
MSRARRMILWIVANNETETEHRYLPSGDNSLGFESLEEFNSIFQLLLI